MGRKNPSTGERIQGSLDATHSRVVRLLPLNNGGHPAESPDTDTLAFLDQLLQFFAYLCLEVRHAAKNGIGPNPRA